MQNRVILSKKGAECRKWGCSLRVRLGKLWSSSTAVDGAVAKPTRVIAAKTYVEGCKQNQQVQPWATRMLSFRKEKIGSKWKLRGGKSMWMKWRGYAKNKWWQKDKFVQTPQDNWEHVTWVQTAQMWSGICEIREMQTASDMKHSPPLLPRTTGVQHWQLGPWVSERSSAGICNHWYCQACYCSRGAVTSGAHSQGTTGEELYCVPESHQKI